jgi:hypothetical protein
MRSQPNVEPIHPAAGTGWLVSMRLSFWRAGSSLA